MDEEMKHRCYVCGVDDEVEEVSGGEEEEVDRAGAGEDEGADRARRL